MNLNGSHKYHFQVVYLQYEEILVFET